MTSSPNLLSSSSQNELELNCFLSLYKETFVLKSLERVTLVITHIMG